MTRGINGTHPRKLLVKHKKSFGTGCLHAVMYFLKWSFITISSLPIGIPLMFGKKHSLQVVMMSTPFIPTVPTFGSCTKCLGGPGIIYNRTPDCHPVSWSWIYDEVKTENNFDSQATRVLDVLDLFVDLLSMGVCTTWNWQTSSRLVQKLNVCTVQCMCLRLDGMVNLDNNWSTLCLTSSNDVIAC